MSTRTLLSLFIAGAAGVAIFLFVHARTTGSGGIEIGAHKAEACTKGAADCLPDVNYVDTSGKAYTAQSLAGKVVVVNFWATWCHPCQQEIPALSKIYDQYKGKDVVFLGVMTDSVDDSQLLNFESDYSMTYPVVRANSDIMVSYNYPQNLPTTLVFNRGGKQVFKQIGGVREQQLGQLLDGLVHEN
jgi:thiol-disulfide isomerase/thioredoxin